MRHCMIDLETMGTRPDAAIVSIGAVFFDESGLGDKFYTPVHLQSCTSLGLTVDQATVDWWAKQSEDAKSAWSDEHAPLLPEALSAFNAWVRQQCGSDARVWGNGASFDITILESAHRVLQVDPPWKYYNVRCFRTLKSLFGHVSEGPRRGTAHHALDDAIRQAEHAVKILDTVGVRLD